MSIQSLDIAERLSTHGLSREQSEAVAREIVGATSEVRQPLVTSEKFDDTIGVLRKSIVSDAERLESRIEMTELKLEARIEAVRNQTLLGVLVVVGFFFALDRFLT